MILRDEKFIICIWQNDSHNLCAIHRWKEERMNGNCHYTPQETTVKRSNWAVQDLLVRYIYFMQGMAAIFLEQSMVHMIYRWPTFGIRQITPGAPSWVVSMYAIMLSKTGVTGWRWVTLQEGRDDFKIGFQWNNRNKMTAARGLRDRTNTFSSPEPPLYDILRRVALGTGMGQTQRLNFGLAQMGTFLGAARQFPAQKIKGKHRKQPVSRKIYEKNWNVHRNL